MSYNSQAAFKFMSFIPSPAISIMKDDWPILNFDKFPNGMISGLTYEEIVAVCNDDSIQDNVPVPEQLGSIVDSLIEPCSSNDTVNTRFSKPLSDAEVSEIHSDSVPESTKRRNTWAQRLFDEWSQQRYKATNVSDQYRNVLLKPITSYSVNELNYWLSKFVLEVRKRDSTQYPQNSLVSIIAGIQGTFHQRKIFHQFFKDKLFLSLQQSLDCAMKMSVKNNIGIHKKQAPIITGDQEEKLWQEGQLGSSTPTQLIQTLFYLNGLHFGIRGGTEHHNLTIDQFEIEAVNDSECLIYREKASKTYQGGLKQRKLNPKIKTYFKNKNIPDERCHIRLFKLFLNHRPQVSAFYLQCRKDDMPSINDMWFTSRPIGVNKLQQFLKHMCSNAGLDSGHTNHSLKATLATRLYHKNVDEQVIMQMTGHRSIEGVRTYKRTESWQIKNACAVVDGSGGSTENVETDQRGQKDSSKRPVFNFYNCNVTIVDKS